MTHPECYGYIRMSHYGRCSLGTLGCMREEHARGVEAMVQDLKLVSTEWNGVYVDGETLVIGYALADHLARINIRTARGLLSALEASPSSFGKLGWSLEQVEAFRAELVELLDGILPGDVLSPPKRPRVRATGGCRPANEARVAELEALEKK